MTVLTENLQEMTGVNWRRAVRFYVPLIEGGFATAGAIATAAVVVNPDEDGVITTPEFLPGRAQVRIDGKSYDFDIPDSPTPVDLAPLLGLSIDFPPPVVQEAQEFAMAAAASAAAAGGGGGGGAVATIAALRSLTTGALSPIQVLGYYATGDGGGGMFRWHSGDTTSTDNGGTIITPTSGLSSSGRWKRVYGDEVNARWFGFSPDSTAAANTPRLQACVDWVSTSLATTGGTVFIPRGYYRIDGMITISGRDVLIRGEGPGTMLTVRHPTTDLDYLFSFSGGHVGGGMRDLRIDGNSELKWAIYLNSWHNAVFENIAVVDVHGGILDAQAASGMGEQILIRHCDYSAASGTDSCYPQYGVRIRSGTTTGSWTEVRVEDCMFAGVWDTAVVLDGVFRCTVRDIVSTNNGTSDNTIDGTSKSGCKCAVRITCSHNTDDTARSGFHVVDGVYLETHTGAETFATHYAILIDVPSDNTHTHRYNRISNINLTGDNVTMLAIVDDTGDGLNTHNTFTDHRTIIDNPAMIYIGAAVEDTLLYLTPGPGQTTVPITDVGTRTVVINNNVATTPPGTDRLTAGILTLPRNNCSDTVALPASGSMHLTYFTADRFMTAADVTLRTQAGAGATPTISRVGLFSVASSGDLTLVASTTNDTALFSTGNIYTKAFTASTALKLNTRYAVGVLVVSAASMPSFFGLDRSVGSAEMAVAPRMAGTVASLSDLPSSVAAGSVGNIGAVLYARIA